MTETSPEDYDVETELPAEAQVLPVADENEWNDETPYDEGAQEATETQDPEVGNENEAATQIRSLVSSSIRSGTEAVDWAMAHTRWTPSGMCQQFTRSTFNVGSYYGSAASAWNNAQHRHWTTNPYEIPRAVPVFWLGGSRGLGHAAVSLGNGYVRSTDWPYRYSVGTARVTDIQSAWGHRLVGWTEDINRVRVWEKKPAIKLRNVRDAMRDPRKIPNGLILKRAIAAEVGKGDMNMRSAILGKHTREQYAKVQEKFLRSHGVTVSRRMADGIPGENSLTWLGRRHGFDVY